MSDLKIGGFDVARYTPLGRPMPAAPSESSFSETLITSLKDINDSQLKASNMSSGFISGEPLDLHDVMVSAEEASVAFELLMEIRNKLLESYQEIQRMQV